MVVCQHCGPLYFSHAVNIPSVASHTHTHTNQTEDDMIEKSLRASKVRRSETGSEVTRTHDDFSTPFTDDYFPYTKGQLERCFSRRRHDDHKRAWNTYYQSNTINGYKDRHYILREFTELNDALLATRAVTTGSLRTNDDTSNVSDSAAANTCNSNHNTTAVPSVLWMEVGCGVGNAVMPALRDFSTLRVCGFDISSVAIDLFKKKVASEGLSDRVSLCVTNLAEEEPPEYFRKTVGLVDFASIIFVLSAVPQSKHRLFLERSRAMMKKGAVLFFRDYYEEDMAQKRFSKENQIDEKTFFRTDGTLSYFFNKEEIAKNFKSSGFELIDEKIVEREVENRKEQNTMHRRWYQARFRCV